MEVSRDILVEHRARLWAGGGNPGVFAPPSSGPGHSEAARRLEDWTRSRFKLTAEETILVSQVAPSLPGFPPVATAVAFWTMDGARHHFSLFKPVEEVVEDDLPPAWLKDALADSDGFCACC